MIIVGGLGSAVGPFFGTILLSGLREAIAVFSPALATAFPAIGAQISASLGAIAFGLVVVLFLVFEPRGLAHRWELIKVYYRLWPFVY